MSSLKQKTFNNVAYTGIARVVALVFQAMANIILSRSLSSSDYGLVGFANIFVNFLTQFSDLGLNSAIVQRKQLDETALYTGFTMKLGIGLFIYIIAFLGSGFAVLFFDNPSVVDVIKLLALNFIINCFGFIPSTLLKRDLDYKKVSLATVCQTIVNSSLAMLLALAGFKYWSIVLASLCSTTAMIIALNVFKPVKLRIMYDKIAAQQFLDYGTSLSLMGLIVFAIFNIDNFIIGTVRGSGELGYYMVAFNWGTVVCTTLYSVINVVLFPTFSRMEGDLDRIKTSYLKVLQYVGFLSILVNTTLLICSKEFLVYVLGHGTEKWLPALASLKILCVYGVIRALLEPLANVFMATGMTKVMLKIAGISAIIEIVCLYPALKIGGIFGVSLLITLTYALQYVLYKPVLLSEFNIRMSEIFKSIKDAIISSFIVIIVANIAMRHFVVTGTITTLVYAVIICTSYVIVYIAFNRLSLVRETIEIIKPVRR